MLIQAFEEAIAQRMPDFPWAPGLPAERTTQILSSFGLTAPGSLLRWWERHNGVEPFQKLGPLWRCLSLEESVRDRAMWLQGRAEDELDHPDRVEILSRFFPNQMIPVLSMVDGTTIAVAGVFEGVAGPEAFSSVGAYDAESLGPSGPRLDSLDALWQSGLDAFAGGRWGAGGDPPEWTYDWTLMEDHPLAGVFI